MIEVTQELYNIFLIETVYGRIKLVENLHLVSIFNLLSYLIMLDRILFIRDLFKGTIVRQTLIHCH